MLLILKWVLWLSSHWQAQAVAQVILLQMTTLNDFSSLSLFLATPEQILVSRKRTFPHWGRGLSEDQYLTRDFQLDKLEHAVNGKLSTWSAPNFLL